MDAEVWIRTYHRRLLPHLLRLYPGVLHKQPGRLPRCHQCQVPLQHAGGDGQARHGDVGRS